MAQVQSAGSVKIETAINKTLSDFNTAIDKLYAPLHKTIYSQVALFSADYKNAIVSIVSTSILVAKVGISTTSTNYFHAVANVSAALNNSDSSLRDYYMEHLQEFITRELEQNKAMLNDPVTEIKEKVKVEVQANPTKQICYETALKDLTPLTAAVKKNITDAFIASVKGFNAKVKLHHGIINGNVTLITKSVSACTAKKPQQAAFLCIDDLLTKEDKVIGDLFLMDYFIGENFRQTVAWLTYLTRDFPTIVNVKKEEILTKIAACAPPPTTEGPPIGEETPGPE